MKINPVSKAIIIVVAVSLTLLSVISAYFDFADVEIKDVEIGFEDLQGEEGLVIRLPEGSVKPNLEIAPGGLEDIPADNEVDSEMDSALSDEGLIDEELNDSEEVPPEVDVVTDDAITWEPSGEYMEIDKLMLVNRDNPIGADYVPVDLVRPNYCATNRSADGQYMTREACDAFNKLAADAAELGYEIVVTTAYRSYNFQSYLYNSYVERDGQEAADKYSARPGTSEHQSGLTADVSSPSVNYELVQAYGDTAEGIWLAENCHKYGFIIRFPEGREDITGYMYEPWHIRYVGHEDAKQIYETGVTLEEYIEQKLN